MNKHQLKKIQTITNRAQFHYGTIPHDHVIAKVTMLASVIGKEPIAMLHISNLGAPWYCRDKYITIILGPRGGILAVNGEGFRRSLILG